MDADKVDMSLLELLGPALVEVCRVMDYGQTKYTRGGFLDVPNAEQRYSAAMLRHYFEEDTFDTGDPFYDTHAGAPFKGKIFHDAQVAVNALFRLQIILNNRHNGDVDLQAWADMQNGIDIDDLVDASNADLGLDEKGKGCEPWHGE
jgi:hypothetical protein